MGVTHSSTHHSPTAAAAAPGRSVPSSILPQHHSVSQRASNRPELSRTGVIKNTVNVKRSSFVVIGGDASSREIQFAFDASSPTRFNVYFNCSEYLNDKKFPILASELGVVESDLFQAGMDQTCTVTLPAGTIEETSSSDGAAAVANKVFPVIVETVPVENGSESECTRQLTYIVKLPAGTEAGTDGRNKVVVGKQKLRYGERGYELHEIFGIERSSDRSPANTTSVTSSISHEIEDASGTDCVICLTNARDTTILPCLHLCLCAQCAQVLSLNTRKCPVCRSPVTGMLQIDRALPPPTPTSGATTKTELI